MRVLPQATATPQKNEAALPLIDFRHLSKAGLYALAGLRRGWRENAFRHEALMLPVIVLLLFLLRPGFGWTAAALFGWLLVMALELLNSAIEEAFDLITQDRNEHVKFGKDMASGAIFLSLTGNAVLWLCMLGDRLL